MAPAWTVMTHEECDRRALAYLLSIEDVSSLSTTGARIFKKDGDFAKAQGLAGKHFDENKLWSILKGRLVEWQKRGFCVFYYYSSKFRELKVGRLIADCGFQNLPRVIRGTLASGVYWDLDMLNAQPVLLQQIAAKRGWEVPVLADYVSNREARLVAVGSAANVTRDEAKGMYIAVLCGASDGTVSKWPALLRSLKKEVDGVSEKVWDSAEFAAVRTVLQTAHDAKVALAKPGKTVWDNRKGSLLSMVMQTEERKVLMELKESLVASKRHVHTLMHDGCHVKRVEGEAEFPAPVLKAAEDAVLAKLGYTITLAVKNFTDRVIVPEDYVAPEPVEAAAAGAMEDEEEEGKKTLGKRKRGRPPKVPPPATAEEVSEGVSKEEYAAMKVEWEKNHFYYSVNNTFVEVSEHGIRGYELKHAQEYFNKKWHFKLSDAFGDMLPFLDLWRKDTSRLCIRAIDFKPSDDPEVFYMPIKFAFEGTVSPEDPAPYVDIFKRLVAVASGNDAPCGVYMTNYLAHILQKPLEQPGVALILTGQKGVGKDTLLDFMREYVVGKVFSHNYTETRQFFDKHDIDRKDKLFIKMEDSDDALCKTFAKDLRARITGREGTINPKGRDPITYPNYARYFFTSNQAVPVGINDDNDRERRFVIFAVSNELKGNVTYWDMVYKTLFTPEGGRAVADYLSSIDLSAYQPRQHPKNEYQENLYETERSPEQRFVEDGWKGEEVSSMQLFKMFQTFCSENGFPKWTETAIGFGQRLAYFVMQKKVLKRIGRKKTAFYRKPERDPDDDQTELAEMAEMEIPDHVYGGGAGAGAGGGGFQATTTRT